MNGAIGCAGMDVAGLSSSDSAGCLTAFCHASVLRAAFSRWEPERPELLVRLRPRVRDNARHGTC